MEMSSWASRLSWALLATFLTSSCAEKSQAPESLTLKMMRMQAESHYQSELPQKDLRQVQSVHRVAFVCCAQQDQEQKLWSQVAKSQPDVVVFTGNSVSSVRYDEKPLSAQYKKLDQIAEYRDLRAKVPFMAVWDELDFGIRNGDSSFQGKNENRQAFLDYWKYIGKLQPTTARGVEHSVILGAPGKRVQFIMLDTRFYATPWLSAGADGEFKKNWNKTDSLLGSGQWAWLESELRKDAEYRVIVSPLQMAANSGGWERWGLFPLDRQKFFDTLRATKAHKVVVVSGNRGFGSLGKVDLLEGYGPLYDMTVGPLNGATTTREDDFHYVGKAVSALNFGLIEWDWKKKKVKLMLMDESNQPVESLSLNL
nr:hypothetical protein HAGR004_22930 [Bdellovibrio sp. HAGR004]